MTTFAPLNVLETALLEVREGQLSVPQFMKILVDATIAVPSVTEVKSNGEGLQPLTFSKGETTMLACFSDKNRIGDFSYLAPYVLTMKGGEFLARVPQGWGIVLNANQPVGFDMTPDGVARAVGDFLLTKK